MGKPTMSTKTKPSGICLTCKHCDSCMYPRDPRRPVLQCEEYEAWESPPARSAVARTQRLPAAQKGRAAHAELKGLCVNCDNRDHCKYPKPEGGVWHCEEYI